MKKVLSLALVCLTLLTPITLGDSMTSEETADPPILVDFRHYKGQLKTIYNKEIQEGTMEIFIEHTKIDNKDMFMYTVIQCFISPYGGLCGAYKTTDWVEGRVSGNNWVIRHGNFNALLGKKNGHVIVKTLNATTHAKLEIV